MESRDVASDEEVISEDTTSEKLATETSDESEVPNEATETSDEVLDGVSQPYEGRWNLLISTTNWEKGQIIFEWRTALKGESAAATEYSDEAWARRVGGVTGQHVGRLRRVYERFGQNVEQYEGLYWSHFQSAIDWEDAEMWLEGSIQNKWSVSKMRKARWEAIGAPDDLKPREEDIITTELNEDLDTREDHDPVVGGEMSFVDDPRSPAGPDFGDEDEFQDSVAASAAGMGNKEGDGPHIYAEDEPKAPFVRPFENIPDLPEDVGESFESFKLCIIRHKTDDWREISKEDMLSALESLKELALAPASSDASSTF